MLVALLIPFIGVGQSIFLRISTRPTAKVTGSTADNIPINPYTSTNLRIAVTGGATCTLPMRDSTR